MTILFVFLYLFVDVTIQMAHCFRLQHTAEAARGNQFVCLVALHKIRSNVGNKLEQKGTEKSLLFLFLSKDHAKVNHYWGHIQSGIGLTCEYVWDRIDLLDWDPKLQMEELKWCVMATTLKSQALYAISHKGASKINLVFLFTRPAIR